MRNSTRRTRPKWRVCTRKSRQPTTVSSRSTSIPLGGTSAQALQLVYNVPRSVERQAAFDAFKEAAGPDLRAFAAWSVAFQVWGAPWEGTWFKDTNRDSPEVVELMREHADMVDFECWRSGSPTSR